MTATSRIYGFAAVRPYFMVSGDFHSIFHGRLLGSWYRDFWSGIELDAGQERTYFRHLKTGEKDYKRSDSGGLFMLATKTGSKLWRYAYNFDSRQKLLALGQYPVTSLADARVKRDDAKKLLSEGIDPSVNRKEERRNARMARANAFDAVAKELMDKFEAEGDARSRALNRPVLPPSRLPPDRAAAPMRRGSPPALRTAIWTCLKNGGIRGLMRAPPLRERPGLTRKLSLSSLAMARRLTSKRVRTRATSIDRIKSRQHVTWRTNGEHSHPRTLRSHRLKN